MERFPLFCFAGSENDFQAPGKVYFPWADICLVGKCLHSVLDCLPQQFSVGRVYRVSWSECSSVFSLDHEEYHPTATCLNHLHQFIKVFLPACCNRIRKEGSFFAEEGHILYLYIAGALRPGKQ